MAYSNNVKFTVYDSLKPLFILSEYVSMFSPYPWKENNASCTQNIKSGFICSVILLCYYLYCLQCAIWNFIRKYDPADLLFFVGQILEILIGGVCILSSLIENAFYRKVIPKWFLELNTVDFEIERLTTKIISNKKLRNVFMKLLLIGLLIFWIEVALNILLHYLPSGKILLYPAVIVAMPMVYSLFSILRFASSLYLIRERTFIIKNFLAQTMTSSLKEYSAPSKKRKLIKWDNNLRRAFVNADHLYELLEVSSEINGAMNVTYSLSVMVMTTFNAFFFLTYVFHPNFIINLAAIIIISLWFAYVISLLFYMVFLASDCAFQVSTYILYLILNNIQVTLITRYPSPF